MDIYTMIHNSVKNFQNKLKKDIITNENVSSAIAAELTIVSTILISSILLRRINVMLTVLIILGLGLYLITNMPLISKLKKEQDDSLNKMMFYVILTLGILVSVVYWGVL
ncbi:MAG: energy-converting hydrogenase B subunit G EhbG [Methanobrevibacter sp.]|jgi:energy-converting hydrogenase B subunit G|nr:energy-converting hydrogenase B subunit G EhbG [Candidatus Methanovirga australis]